MVELLERTTDYGRHFEERNGSAPSVLDEMRRTALAAWNATGYPTHKDEEWKYTSLRDLAETTLQPAYSATVTAEELAAFPISGIDGAVLAFVNGVYSPEHSKVQNLPAGVRVGSLKEAIESDWSLVEPHLGRIGSLEGKLGSTNDERFKHLNTAFLQDGAFVYVPRGVVVEDTVQLLFIAKADRDAMAVHPRVLIVAEEAAQVKVLESYVGLQGTYFTNAVTEVYTGSNALVEHVRFQQETASSYHVGLLAVHQEADSTYTNYNTSFGARVGRTDVNIWSNGEHTESRIDGVYVAAAAQVLDNKTRIDHAKPNCHSFEVYKGILAGRGTGVFNGKIFVYEDAQKTDAKQTNQALLLSPNATINTKPQLEIFADDVKCTHGATIGQLSKDAMFYLRARGIPEKEAQGLLVYAFAADVLERITIEPVREALEKVLYKKLHEETDLETAEEAPTGA